MINYFDKKQTNFPSGIFLFFKSLKIPYFYPSILFLMKKLILLLLLPFCFLSVSAQQNEDFREVKSYFEKQKQWLYKEFQKEHKRGDINYQRLLEEQLDQLLTKIDSLENSAYTMALIKVKTREDLVDLFPVDSVKTKEIDSRVSTKDLVLPQYPGGINELRRTVAKLFYYDSPSEDIGEMKTELRFIVNREGYITRAEASGENPNLNRQALIALYQVPYPFSPALLNQKPVEYGYRLPLIFSFK